VEFQRNRKRTWLHRGLQNDISIQISRDIHQIEDQRRNIEKKNKNPGETKLRESRKLVFIILFILCFFPK